MKRNEPPVLQRAHLIYFGRVQGVGFRYTAERIALEIGLVGWVKNLPDNRVEILCEGTRTNIELLMQRLKASALGSHIKKVASHWEKPTGEFKDFRIEYYY